ncbi:hypothetical protein GY45DRAFT_783724 [Cubamyces sp. BRFM 1775]|nr:hypothetical protein GY45DRAFT_783724 [Cubamyces sp. BRFM 1775]
MPWATQSDMNTLMSSVSAKTHLGVVSTSQFNPCTYVVRTHRRSGVPTSSRSRVIVNTSRPRQRCSAHAQACPSREQQGVGVSREKCLSLSFRSKGPFVSIWSMPRNVPKEVSRPKIRPRTEARLLGAHIKIRAHLLRCSFTLDTTILQYPSASISSLPPIPSILHTSSHPCTPLA